MKITLSSNVHQTRERTFRHLTGQHRRPHNFAELRAVRPQPCRDWLELVTQLLRSERCLGHGEGAGPLKISRRMWVVCVADISRIISRSWRVDAWTCHGLGRYEEARVDTIDGFVDSGRGCGEASVRDRNENATPMTRSWRNFHTVQTMPWHRSREQAMHLSQPLIVNDQQRPSLREASASPLVSGTKSSIRHSLEMGGGRASWPMTVTASGLEIPDHRPIQPCPLFFGRPAAAPKATGQIATHQSPYDRTGGRLFSRRCRSSECDGNMQRRDKHSTH